MRNSFDSIIIGAGIAGCAVARALARAGTRPLLLDRGRVPGEATPASAGMLAAQIEGHAGGSLLSLAVASRRRFPDLLETLGPQAARVRYRASGIAHVALDEASAGHLRTQAAAQRAAGLEAAYWDAAEAQRFVPGLSPDARGALFAPEDGHLDAAGLREALFADAIKAGAFCEFAAATDLLSTGGRVTGVRVRIGGDRVAPIVVLAGGVWSSQLRGLPRPLPVEPLRGQLIRVRWLSDLPQTVVYGAASYLVPWDSEAVLGSTSERVGFDAGISQDGIGAIRHAVASLLPAAATMPIVHAWSGLRPITPDGLPIIGPDPELAGLLYATGHGRNGILLAPITGDAIAGLALRGDAGVDISPCAITRFTP